MTGNDLLNTFKINKVPESSYAFDDDGNAGSVGSSNSGTISGMSTTVSAVIAIGSTFTIQKTSVPLHAEQCG